MAGDVSTDCFLLIFHEYFIKILLFLTHLNNMVNERKPHFQLITINPTRQIATPAILFHDNTSW